MNFFQSIAGFWSSPFRKEEKDSKTQLQELWVNTDEIDTQVVQESEVVKNTMFSEDEFFKDVNTVMSDNNIDYDTAFDETLKYYKSKNFSIDWVNIDEELWVQQPVEELSRVEEPEEPGILSAVWEWLTSFKEWTEDVIGWAIANVPNILWNTFGFVADVLTPEQFEWLWDVLREWGIKDQTQLQEMLWVDSDSFATWAWELWTEIWALFIPGGQAKLAAKFPQAAEKINVVTQWFNNLAKNSPKLFNTLKSALTGAKDVAKFEVVSEWEVTPEWLAVWAVAWPLFDKAAKFISWPTGTELKNQIKDRFGKLAQKLSPSKTTRALADDVLEKGSEWAIITRQANPDRVVENVADVLDMTKKTRDQLWTQLSTARWVGNVETTSVTNWIDDMVEALGNPTWPKAKTLALDKKLWKEFDSLASLPNRNTVIKELGRMKEDIVSRWPQSIKQFDDNIIQINKTLDNFFAGKSDKLSSQVDSAVAAKMRESLDDSIWALGNEFRNIKKIYWQVRTLEDNLNKVYVQAIKRKDSTLWDFADTFILSNMWASIAAWDLAGFSKAFLQKWIKEQVKKQNDTNFVVQQLFKLIDKSLWKTKTKDVLIEWWAKLWTIWAAEWAKEIKELTE